MTAKARTGSREDRLLVELAQLHDEAGRKRFLRRHRRLLRPSVVNRLAEAVREQLRVDMEQALGLAEAAVSVARALRNREALALSLRAKANALWAKGDSKSAVQLHEQALRIFQSLSHSAQVARSLSASIQPLILLGEYDRALAAAEQARQIFTRLGDRRRLARLDINVGNIFHRQDRFREALACYDRVHEQLLQEGDIEGVVSALHNRAVCLISLNDFPNALAAYQQARALCEQQAMPISVMQADYNIAYLYYLRGEYNRAIEMLRGVREACKKLGDAYHLALCYLDLSEIYLELNLGEEAAETAQEAFARFEQLGMGYEAAKSLTNLAIALSQQEKAFRALELFARARAMFVKEKNQVWPFLIDLYQALVLYNEGRFFEARRLCLAALEFFRSSVLPGKAILCQLLLARLSFRTGELESVREGCASALEQLNTLTAPVLSYQAHFLMGQIHEAMGNRQEAYASYQTARQALETLRSSLRGEELKIAFMKNKLELYESLVELCLRGDRGLASPEEAFGYIEQAKSRSLVELILPRAPVAPATDLGQSELVQHVRELREELNWYYHRIDLEQLRPEERSPERIQQLEIQARARENELLRVLRELPTAEAEYAALHAPTIVPLEAIRAALPPEAMLVEYFRVHNRLVVCLLSRETLEAVPVTVVSRVHSLLRMLQFQLSKFRLGADYIRLFQESLLEATQNHLRDLYQELLAPVRSRLRGRHLIFVPHEALHYLPFHALFDGQQYLTDAFTVSYAPSASIYSLCHGKTANRSGASLIFGIPDPQAPFILEEVQAVASILPQPELHLGASATEEVLKEKGAGSRFVHIATHGYFRQDNPMFSAIRLGGSYLNVYDLYHLRLPVELVTLSGCATGMNVVAAGDELLGLLRGLLYAGAQSLLVTLWDAQDRSTAEFMKGFYTRFRGTADKAAAVREAMRELRERYPHPYYWAPFALVGKVSAR